MTVETTGTLKHAVKKRVAKSRKKSAPPKTRRGRLSNDRRAVTHVFHVGEVKCFLTVGLYDEGSVGEVFLQAGHGNASDVGLTGLLDGWAIVFSLALQHGCPLESLVSKFEHTKFEPSGLTGNSEIPIASSIFDYCARWLRLRFLASTTSEAAAVGGEAEAVEGAAGPPQGAVAAPAATAPVYERCRGDGKHGCGHARHDGPCDARLLPSAEGRCRCEGSR